MCTCWVPLGRTAAPRSSDDWRPTALDARLQAPVNQLHTAEARPIAERSRPTVVRCGSRLETSVVPSAPVRCAATNPLLSPTALHDPTTVFGAPHAAA